MAKNIVLFCFIAIEVHLSLEAAFHDTNENMTSTDSWEERSEYSPTVSTEETLRDDCYNTKHHLFCNCSTRVVLLAEDYKNRSGVLYVPAFNASYNISFYRIHDLSNGQVMVCIPHTNPGHDSKRQGKHVIQHLQNLAYVTQAGFGVSLACLFIHLIVFLLVSELRNMPGCNLACLCASTFCGYLSLLLGSIETIYETTAACIVIASMTQFSLLASFFWMNVISFDIFRTMWNSAYKLRIVSSTFQCKKFAFRCLFCNGNSLAIVILSLVMDKIDGVPVEYRPLFGESACWFDQETPTWIYFMGPAFTSIGINVIFFGLSVYAICSSRMNADDNNGRGGAKKNLMLYAKLALITGMLWLSGVLARFVDIIELWYFFTVLIALQGIFIFIGFTLPHIPKNLFHVTLNSVRKPSNVASSSTAKVSTSSGPRAERRV